MSERLPPERRGNWLFLSERYDIEWNGENWVMDETPGYGRVALQIPNITQFASYSSALWSGTMVYMVGPGITEDFLICVEDTLEEIFAVLENTAKPEV